MQHLGKQMLHDYNESTTTGLTEVFATSDFSSYSDSTVDGTNITVLLSSVSSSFVTWVDVGSDLSGRSSSEVTTGVTVSCVSCVIILMIIIPLIIWRCRVSQKHNTTYSTSVQLQADKYDGTNSTMSTPSVVTVTQQLYPFTDDSGTLMHHFSNSECDKRSTQYGSRLQLVSADYSDLSAALPKSMQSTVSTVSSFDMPCITPSSVNGIDNPSYYIIDNEQPSTSYNMCTMFQPNSRTSPGIRRSYRLDGNVAMAIAADRSRNLPVFFSEQNGSHSNTDSIDTDIEIIYKERTAL